MFDFNSKIRKNIFSANRHNILWKPASRIFICDSFVVPLSVEWRTDRPDCDWFHGFTKADGNRETFENRIRLNFVVAPALVLTRLIQLIWQLMSLCSLSSSVSAHALLGRLFARRARSAAQHRAAKQGAERCSRRSPPFTIVSGAGGRLLRAVDAALS